jgi:hypothetical protein
MIVTQADLTEWHTKDGVLLIGVGEEFCVRNIKGAKYDFYAIVMMQMISGNKLPGKQKYWLMYNL